MGTGPGVSAAVRVTAATLPTWRRASTSTIPSAAAASLAVTSFPAGTAIAPSGATAAAIAAAKPVHVDRHLLTAAAASSAATSSFSTAG